MYNILNTVTEAVVLNPDGTKVEFETFGEANDAAKDFTIKTGVEHAPIG